jgi:hypothetical protein
MKRTLKAERSISDNIDRPKFCVCCENLATQEGFFDAGKELQPLKNTVIFATGELKVRRSQFSL